MKVISKIPVKLVKSLPPILLTVLLITLQLLTPNGFGDPDGWYHLGIAKLYLAGQVSAHFPWLQGTILKDTFFDQQYLYHLLLSLHPTPVWAKIITILVALGLFAVLAGILRTQRVIGAVWWSLFCFFATGSFLFRTNLVKGSMIGVLLFFCIELALLSKKYWLLLPIAAAWVLSHGSFVLSLPLVLSYIVIVKTARPDAIRILLYTGAGLCIGYIFHPQHAALLPYFYTQLAVPFTGKHAARVGSEWYAYDFINLVKFTSPLLYIWITALVWWLTETVFPKVKLTKLRTANTWLWLISISWFCLFLSSKRFVEYWVPASTLPIAILISPYIGKMNKTQVVHLLKTSWQVAVGAIALLGCVGVVTWYNTHVTVLDLKNTARADKYKGASEWLAHNTSQGDIVFNTRWDHFPELFYWNQHNYYIVGLDPLFMYNYNSNLYEKWLAITNEGRTNWNYTTVETAIQADFHAHYVFIENAKNPQLINYFAEQTVLGYNQQVYSDGHNSIFKIY